MSTSVDQMSEVQATMSVQIPNGEYVTRKLRNGDALSIGSNETCDLRLASDGVAGTHCMVAVEYGQVTIKDCFSQTGTFVDDEQVKSKTVVYNCMIRLGTNQIKLQLTNPKPRPIPMVVASTKSQQPEAPVSESSSSKSKIELESQPFERDDAEQQEPETATDLDEQFELAEQLLSEFAIDEEPQDPDPVTDSASNRITNLLIELAEAHAEIEILKEQCDQRISEAQREVPLLDPFQEEMIAMLRQEVLALQAELDSRNNDYPSLDLAIDLAAADDQLPDREEVERLVERLETLLDELEQKDEQVMMLEELLLASENANRAEQEEREHLENWLSEFENRFETVSGEWQAERESLTEKIAAAEKERQETQVALSNNNPSARSDALKRLTESLRTQVVKQQDEIDALTRQTRNLKNDLAEAQESSTKTEEVRLARERAEIARMKRDLEVRMMKYQQLTKNEGDDVPKGVEADYKIQEFRQQLREEAGIRNPSLSSRVLSLWGRLNS